MRYSRASAQYSDLLEDSAQLLTQKLLKQGYNVQKNYVIAKRSCGPHHDLVDTLSNIHISNDNEYFPFYVYLSFHYHCQDFYRTRQYE